MLKYLKSDFGIVVLCLVSLFIFVPFFNDDQEWAKYAIGIALLFPVYVFIVWTISAIRNTFFNKK
jgi:hypothetical protein